MKSEETPIRWANRDVVKGICQIHLHHPRALKVHILQGAEGFILALISFLRYVHSLQVDDQTPRTTVRFQDTKSVHHMINRMGGVYPRDGPESHPSPSEMEDFVFTQLVDFSPTRASTFREEYAASCLVCDMFTSGSDPGSSHLLAIRTNVTPGKEYSVGRCQGS
ncbi:hypothetical protein VOLCADRAFT_93135 [Volvox carteri f. nagariensis]|uniref:Uncharacterized protein n=1 Tax=Volvox carteri f. nagariensis TaxID=3068 RepID=D8U1E3_VOLCA|nr:uncharacterized protein VOLCADRAFT_93135 [Volvox carteri f. nagariensis]EFJ46324.1 hypothetical protein VOLCADRAFT_93135 [Volvox carteri f. nagariensis]|eukprot:XP_002952477.1 hypothetical protein VOLCADRAFT_93135 [Volvox carteri f. nagariensis]